MKRVKAAIVLLLAIAVSGCMKQEDTAVQNSIAGKGGVGIIKATPLHGVNLVDSCMVYIKYNTYSKPFNGVYDDSAKCVAEAGKPVATFTQLRSGNYYLYGKGWDGQLVMGGTGWSLTDTTVANAITIPVDN